MNEKYLDVLLRLAEKASRKNEVPVSALIVYNDKIIAKEYNTRQKKQSVLNHAEINVISKASKKLKRWHLNECDLYVTLKPCNMCESVIKQSRIKNVYYILDKLEFKKEYNKTTFAKTNNSTIENKYANYLKEFFQKRRDKK